MPLALPGQCVGKCHTDRAVLAADQQVDMGDLVAFAAEGLTNVHRHNRWSPYEGELHTVQWTRENTIQPMSLKPGSSKPGPAARVPRSRSPRSAPRAGGDRDSPEHTRRIDASSPWQATGDSGRERQGVGGIGAPGRLGRACRRSVLRPRPADALRKRGVRVRRTRQRCGRLSVEPPRGSGHLSPIGGLVLHRGGSKTIPISSMPSPARVPSPEIQATCYGSCVTRRRLLLPRVPQD